MLLLAQAGVPFTTGFLAKLQVVAAAVDVHSVPLAVIAMVSAALAAFFYLRVAVLMYTPGARRRPRRRARRRRSPGPRRLGAVAARGGRPSGAPAPITRLNVGAAARRRAAARAEDDRAGDRATERPRVRVPATVAVVIVVCLAVTVVFGIIPAPVVDFAHKATLLFLP